MTYVRKTRTAEKSCGGETQSDVYDRSEQEEEGEDAILSTSGGCAILSTRRRNTGMSRFSVRRICDCEILRRYLAKAASQPVVVDACIRVYVVELRVCRCSYENQYHRRPTDRPTNRPTDRIARRRTRPRLLLVSAPLCFLLLRTYPLPAANPFCELSPAQTYYVCMHVPAPTTHHFFNPKQQHHHHHENRSAGIYGIHMRSM